MRRVIPRNATTLLAMPPGMLLAILLLAVPLWGQGVEYRAPDGSIKRISRAEHQSRVRDLERYITDVDSHRMVVVTAKGSPIGLVTNHRLHDLARHLEKNGGLDALEVPGWINDQIRISRDSLLPLMRAEMAALRGATTIGLRTTAAAEPPSGDPLAVSFPDPMDWRGARGMIIGTYFLQCGEWRGGTHTAGPDEEGRWGIIFQGDGKVRAGFKPSPPPHDVSHADWVAGNDTQWISGSIDNHAGSEALGQAGGRGPVRGGEFRWAIAVERRPGENRIKAYSSEVRVVAEAPGEKGRSCTSRMFSQIEPR
jgi:hypothetical protein